MSTTLPRLALALGSLALLITGLSLPAISSARDGNDDRTRSDRNGDRIPDRWERSHRLSLRVNQARRDQDRDGLRNREEFLAGTSPRDRDSDDDGVRDGDESAGRVVSFTDGVLVIEPFGTTDALRGKVDASTELECRFSRAAGTGATASRSGGDYERGRGDNDDSGERHQDDGQNDDGDDDRRGHHDDDDDRCDDERGACAVSLADLVPGAIVHEAELEVRTGGAVWEEITLVRPRPAS